MEAKHTCCHGYTADEAIFQGSGAAVSLKKGNTTESETFLQKKHLDRGNIFGQNVSNSAVLRRWPKGARFPWVLVSLAYVRTEGR